MRPIILLVFFHLLALGGFAQTPRELVQVEFPNSVRDFGDSASSVSSHYIFVIDISEKEFCEIIKTRLTDFIAALSDNDWVTVIKLGPTDQTTFLIPTTQVSKGRGDVRSALSRLGYADGSDGLEMTKKVIEALNVHGTSKLVPFVFIFSDFLYWSTERKWNKPPSSDWRPLIAEYSTAAKRFQRGAPIIRTIRLPTANKPYADYLPELKSIFGKIEMESVLEKTFLESYFTNVKAKIYGSILQSYIINKAKSQIDDLHLTFEGTKANLLSSEKLVYDQIVLDESSQALIGSITKKSGLFSFFPPATQVVKLSGTLKAANYNKEITDLKDVEFKDQPVTIVAGDSYIPWWLTDVLALVLLLLFLRMIWCLFPSSFNGMITFTSLSNSDAANFNYNSSGKKTLTLGYGQLVASDKNLFGSEEFSLKVTAKRHFMKGKCIELLPQKGELRGKKGSSVIRKNVKTLVKPSSKWSINGVDIRLPNVR